MPPTPPAPEPTHFLGYQREAVAEACTKLADEPGRHEPKPMMLLATWPVRKLHQTIKARIEVSAARV